jgi:hypothetical protein
MPFGQRRGQARVSIKPGAQAPGSSPLITLEPAERAIAVSSRLSPASRARFNYVNVPRGSRPGLYPDVHFAHSAFNILLLRLVRLQREDGRQLSFEGAARCLHDLLMGARSYGARRQLLVPPNSFGNGAGFIGVRQSRVNTPAKHLGQ